MSSRQRRRRSKRQRSSVRAGVIGGGALALALVPAGVAQATPPIKVTNLHDDGAGSLRAAITEADADTTTKADPALITFGSKLSGSIDLKTQLPRITQSVDIDGPGARKLTLNATAIPKTAEAPVFYDGASLTELTISGLSMDHALVSNFAGTWLQVDGAELTLNRDTFAADHGSFIGGAVSAGEDTVNIDGCTFTDDGAHYGGAVEFDGSALIIKDSTFVGNHAHGAGALSVEGLVTVTGSTVTGNSADFTGTLTTGREGYGGGVAVYGGKLTLLDSIVAGNTATGNVHYLGPHPLAGSDHRDVYLKSGATMSTEFSLIQHDTSDLMSDLNSTDITGKSPDLGPLKNNGGQTNTELPFAKSPVINAGKAFGLKTDQRGDKRTVVYPHVKKRKGSDGTDIGAVELQLPKKKHRR
jgi:hypothetical protein